jgi:hypothetical protein
MLPGNHRAAASRGKQSIGSVGRRIKGRPPTDGDAAADGNVYGKKPDLLCSKH